MASSPHLLLSSPIRGGDRSRRSAFTFRQFGLMASYATANPLRVIAHVDLDAFYAQCEMVRLGIPEDQPLAVQQWQGLIAINYPARAHGIGRHCDVTEAKKLCPSLIAQHVATWREGDDKWAYRDDAAANIATDKVSLDPFRLQSRKILALIKETLPAAPMQKVEKASIDEVFMDLSAQVHGEMLKRFPELAGPPPYDDPTETLPMPSVSALDWQADALIGLDEDQESTDPDWDDVAILIGSEIVRDVRARIRQELGYTCSGGVASNKLISKLGSGYQKPNRQTVVRRRAVQNFLAGFKITKMRNLGGKLGDQVVSIFHKDTVSELLEVGLEEMKAKLGDDTGLWMYNTMRGIDTSEVNSRTQIKSMLSAKSFRPTINSIEQAERWLRIFSADIFSRLVEEGVLEHKRRPRTINLHHRHQGQMKSRQGPIPQGKGIDELMLFELAKDLLAQIVAEGKVWPCANLSLSVGGFEDGVKGNMGIDAFVVRGDEAENLRATTPDSRPASTGPTEHPFKKRRVDGGGAMHKFLTKRDSTEEQSSLTRAHQGSGADAEGKEAITEQLETAGPSTMRPQSPSWTEPPSDSFIGESAALKADAAASPSRSSLAICARCQAHFSGRDELQSHSDWHMAKDIQGEEERGASTFAERSAASRSAVSKGASSAGRRGKPTKLEQGQSKLKFG